MPYVHFNGQKLVADTGENLRRVLLKNECSPHNKGAYISCQGLGSCGTCAIEITKGNAGAPTRMEKWRLRFPPHKGGPVPMRLACQVAVDEDLHIRKHAGFWGSFPPSGL